MATNDFDDMSQFGMANWDGMESKDQPRQTNRVLMLLRGRYHWAIILATVFGLAGGMAGYFRKGNEFQSHAQIRIPQSRDVLLYNDVDTRFQINTFDSYMESQVQLIKSPQVLNEAIIDPRFEQYFGKLPKATALEIILHNLVVNHPRKLEVINFAFVNDSPDKAQAGVQSVLDAYLTYTRNEYKKRGSDKINQIRTIRQAEQNKISRLQQEKNFLISEFGTETTIIVEHDNLRNNIQEIKLELRDLQEKIKSFVPSYNNAPTSDSGGKDNAMASDAIVAQLALTDPHIRTMLSQKELLEARLHMYDTRGIGAGHQEVQNTRAELRAVKRQIDQYVLSGSGLALDASGAPQSPIKQLRAREQTLEEEIDEKEAAALTLAERINKIAQINEEIGETKDDLNFTNTRLEKLEVEQPEDQTVDVLNSGDYPLEPYNSAKRMQFGLVGFAGGAGFGVGIILLVGLADRRLRHAEDAQAGFKDVRMLGVLPTLPSELTDPEQAAIASHAVHHIRALLQIAAAPDENERMGLAYSVTGPAAGSGKTSMTISLGLSFAATGSKTLLIDSDLVAGGLTRRLDIAVHMPLSEVLFNNNILTETQVHEVHLAVRNRNITEAQFIVDRQMASQEQVNHALEQQQETAVGILEVCAGLNFRDAIGTTDIENLHVLPIGNAQPHHAGQLSPVELRKLVDQARRYYDIILVDTGPVLGSLEASIMSSNVDNVIMVVSRGDNKSLTYKSFEHLYSLKAKVAGVVFNHALSEDMQKTSYATMSAAQSRRQSDLLPREVFTQQQSERYGPLASAVASYGSVRKNKRTA
ncbi:AAA family ATPase [Planctomycetota bacterium]|nr:AAA family ATPase [Planctomycetota bacterium]